MDGDWVHAVDGVEPGERHRMGTDVADTERPIKLLFDLIQGSQNAARSASRCFVVAVGQRRFG